MKKNKFDTCTIIIIHNTRKGTQLKRQELCICNNNCLTSTTLLLFNNYTHLEVQDVAQKISVQRTYTLIKLLYKKELLKIFIIHNYDKGNMGGESHTCESTCESKSTV